MVIVYQSKTGFTKQYAEMLGESEHVEVLPLKEAEQKLSSGTPVLFLGPLSAGRIVGLERARKAFVLRGVCGVGMSCPLRSCRRSCARAISWGTCLSSISRAAGPGPGESHDPGHGQSGDLLYPERAPGQGADRTPREEAMLDMLLHGGALSPRTTSCPPELAVQAVIFP